MRKPISFWVHILRNGKKLYTLADLMHLTGLEYPSCRIAVSRLTKKGLLTRLGKELYGNLFVPFSTEEAICQSYLPSYISCESALASHGVLDQVPQTVTAVTLRRTKKTNRGKMTVHYYHIRKNLFWGYDRTEETFMAEPEKALLDWIYFRLKNKMGFPTLDEMNWENLDTPKLYRYARKFPKDVQRSLQALPVNV